MTESLTHSGVLGKLQALVAERFSIDMERLGADAKLRDLHIDSMHIVEIMLDIEDALGIHLGGIKLPKDPTLAAVAEAIRSARPAL